MFTQDEMQLLASLSRSTPAYESDLLDAIQPVSGTCEWILENAAYKSWLRSSQLKVLWMTGWPGSGKTVLANFLVQRLRADMPSSLCYFFFSHDNERRRSAASATCAILLQLFQRHTYLMAHAMKKWKLDGNKILEDFWSLWGILTSAAEDPHSPKLVCVLDGLDECTEESQMYLVKAVSALHEDSAIEFIITSRPYGNIEESFQGPSIIRIRAEDVPDQLNRDIETVVGFKLERLVRNGKLNPHSQDRVRESLLRNAEHTFLWVALILEEFEAREDFQGTDKQYSDVLSRLPLTLDAVYENILRRSKDPQLVRRIIHIILAAARPLTLAEMNAAMSISPKHKALDDLKANMIPERGLEKAISDCCGLLVKFEGPPDRRRVKLMHHTAREFLMRNLHRPKLDLSRGLTGIVAWLLCLLHQALRAILAQVFGLWKNSFDPVESHRIVAEACISYLMLSEFQDDPRLICSDPRGTSTMRHAPHRQTFLNYCARHWAEHFRQADTQRRHSLVTTALRCFDTESRLFWVWYQIYWTTADAPFQRPRQVSPLMAASYFGLRDIAASALATKPEDVAGRDEGGRTALHMAAVGGHDSVARLLLCKKADVNARDTAGRTSLHWATIRGHETVARLLLRWGAKVEIETGSGWTALHFAAMNGHEPLVGLYLGLGSGSQAANKFGWTALHWAAMNGHAGVARLLIQSGAALDAKTNNGWSPVYVAAMNGCLAVVQLLLQHGADLHAPDLQGSSPLHKVAGNGHVKVTEVLIHNDADIEAKDAEQRTALYLAAMNSQEPVVCLLLDNDADAEAADIHGRSALHRAVLNSHTQIVKCLLEHQVDPSREMRDSDGRSALHLAALCGNLDGAVILLNNDADAGAKDKTGMTPLHFAAAGDNNNLVKALLNYGANVNEKNNSGLTALHISAERKAEAVIRTLLSQKDVDVDARDDRGRTALHLCALRGGSQSTRLLLEGGADAKAGDNRGRTALHRAIWNGDEELTRILIDLGGIGTQDHEGKTSLHRAVHRGHAAIARLLLNRSPELAGLRDRQGRTAFDLAKENKSMEQLFSSMASGV